MKLYAWAIIGFKKLENGNVTFGQYLFWSEATDQKMLYPMISKEIERKFPPEDGWFETAHNIVEYNGSLLKHGK